MSCMLKITSAGGTIEYASDDIYLKTTAAGRITDVSYAGASALVTVTAIPQYDGTNTLYEYGHLTDGPVFSTILSNR